ncbi:MAG: aldo/keto reductase [Armatimonadota bacterium]
MPDRRRDKIGRRAFLKKAAAGAALGAASTGLGTAAVDTSKIRSYNPEMEYRPLGDTGIMVSAVCLGGHWKRVDTMIPGIFGGGKWLNADLDNPDFKQNRYDVVSRCIERGINYIDACTWQEVMAYSEALRDRRDSMYLGFSWYQEEMRKPDYRTAEALLGTLDKGMRQAKLDYVDVWRITMISQSSKHTEGEVEQMMIALDKAREQGKVRFTGLSSHDRPHIKWMIEAYPEIVQVVCTPFTVKSKERPTDSLFDAVRQHGVGVFGIKPFGGTSLFKGDSTLDSPDAEADDEIARLTIRYILATDAITAPIPGLINAHQVDNMARAVQERRELDGEEQAKLEKAGDEMYARLPSDYQWLKDWEWV